LHHDAILALGRAHPAHRTIPPPLMDTRPDHDAELLAKLEAAMILHTL
jgi:hypothetical protein